MLIASFLISLTEITTIEALNTRTFLQFLTSYMSMMYLKRNSSKKKRRRSKIKKTRKTRIKKNTAWISKLFSQSNKVLVTVSATTPSIKDQID